MQFVSDAASIRFVFFFVGELRVFPPPLPKKKDHAVASHLHCIRKEAWGTVARWVHRGGHCRAQLDRRDAVQVKLRVQADETSEIGRLPFSLPPSLELGKKRTERRRRWCLSLTHSLAASSSSWKPTGRVTSCEKSTRGSARARIQLRV